MISTSLQTHEIGGHLDFLHKFLGQSELKKRLDSFQRQKQSGRYLKNDYLDNHLHPWFPTLLNVRTRKAIPKQGQAAYGPALRTAVDSLALQAVLAQTKIPERLLKDIRGKLLDPNHGHSQVLEIRTAYHFLRRGYSIDWVDTAVAHPEFIASSEGYSFQVECKYLFSDTTRLYRKEGLLTLFEYLSRKILKCDLIGGLHIEIDQKLPNSDQDLQELASAIVRECLNAPQSNFSIGQFQISSNLRKKVNLVVQLDQMVKDAMEAVPLGSHAVILSSAKGGPQLPLIISLRAMGTGKILTNLENTICDATKQFEMHIPGVIVVYWDGLTYGELEDFDSLSQFQFFNHSILKRKENLASILYMSGPFVDQGQFMSRLACDGLQYNSQIASLLPSPEYRFVDPPRINERKKENSTSPYVLRWLGQN